MHSTGRMHPICRRFTRRLKTIRTQSGTACELPPPTNWAARRWTVPSSSGLGTIHEDGTRTTLGNVSQDWRPLDLSGFWIALEKPEPGGEMVMVDLAPGRDPHEAALGRGAIPIRGHGGEVIATVTLPFALGSALRLSSTGASFDRYWLEYLFRDRAGFCAEFSTQWTSLARALPSSR